MNKVKAGITILSNTTLNTTFIASELDQEVQTGTRRGDSHIEWEGELAVEVIDKSQYHKLYETAIKLIPGFEDWFKVWSKENLLFEFSHNYIDVLKEFERS